MFNWVLLLWFLISFVGCFLIKVVDDVKQLELWNRGIEVLLIIVVSLSGA